MYPTSIPEQAGRFSRKAALVVLISLCMMFAAAPCAFAHKVLLSAYLEGDQVIVEGGFSDGTMCANAGVEVFAPSGEKLLEGTTDENGEFAFTPPQKTDLTLVLDAGMGHRGEYTVPAAELPDAAGSEAEKTEPAPATAPAPEADAAKPVATIDLKEIESIVDRVVQKRLQPVVRLAAKAQQDKGVSPTEVFGGIGYIFGLMGVALYFSNRKKR